MKKYKKISIVIFIVTALTLTVGHFIYQEHSYKFGFKNPLHLIFRPKTYTNADFNLPTHQSNHDQDNDGVDDYTDILNGAKNEAARAPRYRSAYIDGGYPDPNEGVCTDLIWRAFKDAGYLLKDDIDFDIANHLDQYPDADPDPNIDFRRVKNLIVFFDRHATQLTTDVNVFEEWQAGDIVVFSNTHIGIISDKRDKDGTPYLLHNDGVGPFEDNSLRLYDKALGISRHYRWIIDSEVVCTTFFTFNSIFNYNCTPIYH